MRELILPGTGPLEEYEELRLKIRLLADLTCLTLAKDLGQLSTGLDDRRLRATKSRASSRPEWSETGDLLNDRWICGGIIGLHSGTHGGWPNFAHGLTFQLKVDSLAPDLDLLAYETVQGGQPLRTRTISRARSASLGSIWSSSAARAERPGTSVATNMRIRNRFDMGSRRKSSDSSHSTGVSRSVPRPIIGHNEISSVTGDLPDGFSEAITSAAFRPTLGTRWPVRNVRSKKDSASSRSPIL